LPRISSEKDRQELEKYLELFTPLKSMETNKQEKEAVAIEPESPPNKKRRLEPTNQET